MGSPKLVQSLDNMGSVYGYLILGEDHDRKDFVR